jgi:PleD family two-component response regulator
MLADFEIPQAEAKFTDLLADIAGCNYEYKKDGQDCYVRFTVSCGLAEFSPEETADDLLRRADEALYEAKRTGKNRVVLAKKQKSFWKTLKPFVPFGDPK